MKGNLSLKSGVSCLPPLMIKSLLYQILLEKTVWCKVYFMLLSFLKILIPQLLWGVQKTVILKCFSYPPQAVSKPILSQKADCQVCTLLLIKKLGSMAVFKAEWPAGSVSAISSVCASWRWGAVRTAATRGLNCGVCRLESPEPVTHTLWVLV
jgi:hypothetical protein